MSMPNYDSSLNIVFPRTLSEEISDFLLLNADLCNGFTMLDTYGMGQGASLLSPIEKVQGRCQRNLIIIVGERDTHLKLIDALSEKIRSIEIFYWITPVVQFGRLV